MSTAPISTPSDLLSSLNAAGPATKLADPMSGDRFARVLSGVAANPSKTAADTQSAVKNNDVSKPADRKSIDTKKVDAKTDNDSKPADTKSDKTDQKDSKGTDVKTDDASTDDKPVEIDGKEVAAAVIAAVTAPIIAPVVDASVAAQAVATTVVTQPTIVAPTVAAPTVQAPAISGISATAPAAAPVAAPADATAIIAPVVADPTTTIADPTALATPATTDLTPASPQAPTAATPDATTATTATTPSLTDLLQQTQGDAPVVTKLADLATAAAPADIATPSALPSDAAMAKAALDNFAATQVTNDNTQSAVAATRTTSATMQSEPYRQVVNIVAPLKHLADGDYTMTLKLHPEHLGSVEITVALSGGQINMSMNSDNPAARQQLRDSMSDLRSSLSDSGLSAGSLDVGSHNTGDQQGRFTGSTSTTRVDVNDEDTSLLRFAVQAPQNVTTTGDSALDIKL